MSAIIIDLAEWLMAHRPADGQLPKADEVAREYIRWLRREHPAIRPQTAAAMLGQRAWTWREVERLYAAAWEALPEGVRRAGSQ